MKDIYWWESAAGCLGKRRTYFRPIKKSSDGLLSHLEMIFPCAEGFARNRTSPYHELILERDSGHPLCCASNASFCLRR